MRLQKNIFHDNINKISRNSGYFEVKLYKNGKSKSFFVHRLVAVAFVSNINNLPQVNHKDENTHNNHADNLEWCDASYNQTYGTVRVRAKETLRLSGKSWKGKYHTTESKEKNELKEIKEKVKEIKDKES